MSDNQLIRIEDYNILVEQYAELQENDPVTAFSLMKDASVLQEYFDSKVAECNQYMINSEKNAKGIEAMVAFEHRTNGKGVGDSEKMAMFNDRTKEAWESYSEWRKNRDLIQAQANMLGRIYYDCKAIWEQANRKYRENRGG